MHVWDEFSEFLPENRVPTSADFNTYPIRIFFCVLTSLATILILYSVHCSIYIAARTGFGGVLLQSVESWTGVAVAAIVLCRNC